MKRTKHVLKRKKGHAKTGPIPDITRKTLELLTRLAMLGMSNKEIAMAIGKPVATLDYWIAQYQAVKEAIHNGRVIAVAEVAAALHKKAVGYSHPGTHICVVKGEVVETQITKFYPPDTAACVFILKNKTRNQAEPWSDSVQHQLTVTKQLQLTDDTEFNRIINDEMSIEELKALQKLGVLTNFTQDKEVNQSKNKTLKSTDIN